LESIVTGPNDEWPIHPSDEWPIRPDSKPGDAREADHANGQTQPLLPRIYVAPDETDTSADRPNKRRALREAIPRRALISDDQPPIISIRPTRDGTGPTDDPKPTGTSDHDNDVWPVLPQKEEPKPKFDLYVPDEQSETYDEYWPHLPLPEKSTLPQKVRRLAWIAGVSLSWPLLLTILARFVYPDDPPPPEIQFFGFLACAFCFVVAYSEQLFIGGDH
jgi:hypothetical protein